MISTSLIQTQSTTFSSRSSEDEWCRCEDKAGKSDIFLAILLIGGQVFAEAMPAFYANLHRLGGMLTPLSPTRKNHIRHLSFRWRYINPA